MGSQEAPQQGHATKITQHGRPATWRGRATRSFVDRYRGNMRCLLAADLELSGEDLRHVMRRLQIDLVEINRLGVDWLTESPTPPVDFVCGVLRQQHNRDSEAAVLVDIGVALGRRIPVFLIVEPPRKTPLVVAGLTRVEADLTNEGALELHLRQFLRAIRRGKPEVQPKKGSPALSHEDAELARARLRALRPASGSAGRSASQHFEHLIRDLLDTRDADVSAFWQPRDLDHDLALWAHDTGGVLDSPVLVQLKLWADAPSRALKGAIETFAKQLSRQPAPFGLLIYHSMSGNQREPVPADTAQPRVVAVSAHELVDMLSRQPLGRLLISMRNAVMHGVPYRG